MSASIRDYDGLIAAIRSRIVELQITHETIDNIAGLQAGYTGKLMAPVPLKHLGPMSLGALLGAIGLKLEAVADEAALARVIARHERRKKDLRGEATQVVIVVKMSRRKHARFGRKGGKARALKMSQVRRVRSARIAANARARKLSPARRREIAMMGVKARLAKRRPTQSGAVHPLGE